MPALIAKYPQDTTLDVRENGFVGILVMLGDNTKYIV